MKLVRLHEVKRISYLREYCYKSGEHQSDAVVNSDKKGDNKNYGEALRSCHNDMWTVATKEEFDALESNGVWVVVVPPKDSHILHTKWVFKTKTDADGAINVLKPGL